MGRWGGYKCAGLLQVVQYIKKRKFERQKMFVNIVLVCATQKVKKCTISRDMSQNRLFIWETLIDC